ncbi:MAG: hypothetical protein IPO30_19085 [Hyphomonadaceae bacterium]|nr:hypothetical protein [Hyphomonadaceae bacterium]
MLRPGFSNEVLTGQDKRIGPGRNTLLEASEKQERDVSRIVLMKWLLEPGGIEVKMTSNCLAGDVDTSAANLKSLVSHWVSSPQPVPAMRNLTGGVMPSNL